MAFMRPAPAGVTQANTWWCWAACLEILNSAHPTRFTPPARTQAEWLAAMQASPAAHVMLNTNGGLNVERIGQFFNALNMHGHAWAGPPKSPPDVAFIEDKLQHSYVMACYTVPGGSHFVIIYGVDAQRVHYFNPAVGAGNTSATHAQIRSGRLVIGWFA